VTVVRSSPRPSWPLKKCSCLNSADAGRVGYSTLTLDLFFTSGLGVRPMNDEDASLRSGVLSSLMATQDEPQAVWMEQRAILEAISPDVARLAPIREDGRSLGSIDFAADSDGKSTRESYRR
jgi:hypothetical protein